MSISRGEVDGGRSERFHRFGVDTVTSQLDYRLFGGT
jgi:hypothetical protein